MSVQSVKTPIHFETDREAIARALDSLALRETAQAKVLRIQDTLSLEHVEVSEGFAQEVGGRPGLAELSPLAPMQFDAADNLQPVGK